MRNNVVKVYITSNYLSETELVQVDEWVFVPKDSQLFVVLVFSQQTSIIKEPDIREVVH